MTVMTTSEREPLVSVDSLGGYSSPQFPAAHIAGGLKRNPYGMVAGAAAIGFILGGGLFTRLGATILRVGLHIGLTVALPMLEKQIARSIG
jgi:hypothetical protein